MCLLKNRLHVCLARKEIVSGTLKKQCIQVRGMQA